MDVELRVVWNLPHDNGSEHVRSVDEAARLIVRREEFEGRRFGPEECNLLRIELGDGGSTARIWGGESGENIHAYVANERVFRENPEIRYFGPMPPAK